MMVRNWSSFVGFNKALTKASEIPAAVVKYCDVYTLQSFIVEGQVDMKKIAGIIWY